MLDLQDVHTYYGESYVLRGISLAVQEDSAVALLGRNGMGKTTTIRSIIGFTPARRGVIRFRKKEITHLLPHQIAQLGIGLVPQGRYIFSSLSVRENLTMSARTRKKENVWSIDTVFSRFPVLKTRAHNRGNQLSGGEQQMLAISRALMTNPDVLLMDEPSEGLAPLMVKEITRIVRGLKENGFSILLVEQNLPMALGVADDVYIISKGVVVHECSPEQLKNNEEMKATYLGAAAEKH
jgi:branched-chain amino acid transport system ATP-binding protein